MTGCWSFDRVAEGLLFSDLRQLSRRHPQDAMLDVNGVPLARGRATEVHTWRSHHAFSGRCGLSVKRPTEPSDNREAARRNGGGDVPNPEKMSSSHECTFSRSPDDYRAWEVDFHLQSTSETPHVLLSVAPQYLPLQSSVVESGRSWCPPTAEEQEMYDKRILETPLIWEEPMTLSVDCTTNGIFLWSDEWRMFGEKIADRCFSRRIQSHVGEYSVDNTGPRSVVREGPYEAFVRLSWRMMAAGECDAYYGEKRSFNDSSLPNTCVGPRYGEVSVFLRTSNLDQEDEVASVMRQRDGGGTVRARGGESVSSGAQVWERAGGCAVPGDDVPDEMYFAPYVTLMDAGDEAILL
ncbi:uncharacterized protein Tco025E_00705 [Trypanosoma conorhini]|uniref:Uncharacterized protein n=1 Tax=Trypanosoma conorhini TaxID=83891 RepID=A0A422QAN7_9TRYP|nr:uncharacterized protein Tco025E_00705 [Trypanosoma conorhini]RNF27021.1 hypothetical protein Tco025E_00705 [Trypanosoma conorhini]